MNLRLLKFIRFFHLISKDAYNQKRQVITINNSGLFDAEWYLSEYPDIKQKCANPVEHYVLYGWKEGKNPNKNFNGDAYVEAIPQLQVKGWCPLFHYIIENREKSETTLSIKDICVAILHYIRNFLIKVIYYGKSEDYVLVARSKQFDKKWYLKQHPYVKKHPIEYYLNEGWKLGHNPNPSFDGQEYLMLNTDVKNEVLCPLLHYLYNNSHPSYPSKDICFPNGSTTLFREFKIKRGQGRTVIFAAFSRDGLIPETTLYYLKELNKIANNVIFISDAPIFPEELSKIEKFVSYCAFVRHNEYDFGSYKRGFLWAYNKGILANTTELIFCNDSCFGPIYPFDNMFNDMKYKNTDFWGISANKSIKYHLQSYFLVFYPNVFLSNVFKNFIFSIKRQKGHWATVLNYEVALTSTLNDAGFSCLSYMPYDADNTVYPYLFKSDVTAFPMYCLKCKSPLIKVKSLKKDFLDNNCEGINNTIDLVARINPHLGNLLKQYKIPLDDIHFSIIMPTYNRKSIIDSAIQSALKQSYQKFELIIVDDGSVDGTDLYISQNYANEIKSGKIKYYYKEKAGVCQARNYGLKHAMNEWITYLDSDNMLYPNFLEIFAYLITNNPNFNIFYTQGIKLLSRHLLGRPYNYQELIQGNYIDLGMFAHHVSVYNELGGFDENMKRLVDWELIIRYTRHYYPYFLNVPTLLYNDANDRERISNSENWVENYLYLCSKHYIKTIKSISVIVPIYNALDDVKLLLKSLTDNFNFSLGDITLIDDCSQSDTKEYLRNWCLHDKRFNLLENHENLGFIKTCNRGMKSTKGDIVCLLNSDTMIPQGFCEKILRCFIANKKIGIASPIGSSTLEYCIPMPQDKTLGEMNKIILHYHGTSYPRIPAAEGFCFCIRKDVIKQQGYLDEKFGKGYHEEVDFSYRALKNGWYNVLIHDLYVYHKRQASFGEEQRKNLIAQNNPLFYKRWKGFREAYVKKNHLTNPIIKIKKDLSGYLSFEDKDVRD